MTHLKQIARIALSTILVLTTLIIFALSLKSSSASTLQNIHSGWADPTSELNLWNVEVKISNSSQIVHSTPLHSSTEAWKEDWWTVAIQNSIDNNWEIYTTKPDGAMMTRLTDNTASDILPNMTQDVQRIVYVSTRDGNAEIYTMKSTGESQMRLTNNDKIDTQPKWSPDGSKIVFVSMRDDNAEIYVMSADGTDLHRLTNSTNNDVFPDWSSDGRQIIWISAFDDTFGSIWSMNSDGSGAYLILSSLKYVQHPSWSPNMKMVAFDYDMDNDGLNELAVMNTDGTNLKMLVDGGNYPSFTVTDMWSGGWTPDGLAVLYFGPVYVLNDPNTQTYQFESWSNISGICVQECQLHFNILARTVAQPSVRNRDWAPPTTRLHPLSPYTQGLSTFLEWSAQDAGPSGILSYEAQYRTETDNEWKYFQYGYSTSQYINGFTKVEFTIDPTSIVPGRPNVFFRVRARDNAENIEAWRESDEGIASTKFYLFGINGTLTDQRGVPVSYEPINIMPQAIEPIATNLQGKYLGRVLSDGEYVLDNKLQVRLDYTTPDVDIALYRLPKNNLIQNGGFEKRLRNWTATGSFTTTSTSGAIYEGENLASVGGPCIGYCPKIWNSNSLQFSESGAGYVLTDSKGGLHVLGPLEGAYSFKYYYLPQNGVWQEIEVPYSYNLLYGYDIVMDHSDNIHIVWSIYRDMVGPIVETKYIMMDHETQQWTEAEVLPSGVNPRMIANSIDDLFIVFESLDGSGTLKEIYRKRSDTKWSAPTTLIQNTLSNSFTFAATSDGVLHFLWRGNPDNKNERLIYSTKSPIGVIKSQDIPDSQAFFSPNLIVTDDQILHATWTSNDELFYTERMTNTDWSKTESLLNDYDAQLRKDLDGNIHVLATKYFRGGGIAKHRMKIPGKPWGKINDIVSSDYQPIRFYAVTSDTIYADFQGTPLKAFQLEEVQLKNTLAQSVTISPDMHEPTLSFMDQIASIQNGAFFAVEIESESNTSRILTKTQNAPWQLNWFDLSAWTGQNITITFIADSTASKTPIRLLLDDISLGSWYTPKPVSASMENFKFGVGGDLIITGENFIQTPAVFLGDTELSNTLWSDSNHIQSSIPSNIPVGIYNLKVINPGGYVGYWQSTIAIGDHIYLPFIVR